LWFKVTFGSWFMVGKAVCCEEGVLDVQENWRFNQPCKDIPNGFAAVLSEDYM